MDRETAQEWLDRYVAAWKSYDPHDISALFSEDVAYRFRPNDEAIIGRVAVIASWLDDDARDAPGTYEAEYFPIAVDGDTVVATGSSQYRNVLGGPVTRSYDNCFVLRFDKDGRCRQFTDYFVRR